MIEPRQLIDNINRLGIHFLVDEGNFESAIVLTPAEILAELAAQPDARIRLALIAVLLQRPEFAKYAHQALTLMDEPSKLTFKLYYTAAHYLQIIYANPLREVFGVFDKLPDYFSEELKIGKDQSATNQLMQVAEHHKIISGRALNWYGTYTYAAQRVITRLKKERAWAKV